MTTPAQAGPAAELRAAAVRLRVPLALPFELAVADLLDDAAKAYETDVDEPGCPNCGEGCPGHAPITYHVDCGEDVALCTCITHALAVARALLGGAQ